MVNRYDDVRLDVAALLKQQDASLAPAEPTARSGDGLGVLGRLGSLVRLYALGALVKLGCHRRLVYANVRLDWFLEFQHYWVEELGNRPIHPHDFYFLSGVYRQRLQTIHFEQIENPALASDERHLEAWRDHRAIYYLFSYTYRQALSPLRVHPFVAIVPRRGRVAEYGVRRRTDPDRAGSALSAPRSAAGGRRYPAPALPLCALEIPTGPVRDAWFRWPPTTMHPSRPLRHDLLPGGPRAPAAAARRLEHFHRALKPGWHLIFDYVRSEGTGLDTATSLRDRLPALRFVLDHFDIVEGRVTTDGAHVEPTVARKR